MKARARRIATLLKRTSRKERAHALVLAGAAIVAIGTALIYLPAGMMLGGIELSTWALLLFDVDG